jgi:4-amino-4-deoxy-L-arabinose transferase-like glycosyltransferase
MSAHPHSVRGSLCAWAACLFFFSAGRAFLPHLGIQNDEALFASVLYQPRAAAFMLHIGHWQVPLMLMSYLGTLKAWIYCPIFRLFGTGVSALRDPVLLAGVASVWLFFLLLRRVAGDRAAIIGCGLLAVDSLYLLTTCFDWGPVALQHLLLLAGLLLLVGFYQTRQDLALLGGAFLLGLAMWDKALATWMLTGIGIAGILTFRRQIFAVTTVRRVATAALAFALGALPLIIYNVHEKLATFRSNMARDTSNIPGKARLLMNTANGQGLFGWMVNEDWQAPVPHQPQGWLPNASAHISSFAGHPRHNLMLFAFALALLLALLARGNALRTILFALIAMAVAWVQMAVTANAGASVHHAILLWPFPEMVIAVSFAAASRRMGRAGIPSVAAVLVVLMVSGALVTNEYYTLMLRNGGSQNWTDAIFTLSGYMKRVPSNAIYCADWGIMDSLRLLNRGQLPLNVGTDPIRKPELSPDDRDYLNRVISEPSHVFIAHTADYEFFQGVNAKLLRYAADAGYERAMMAIIPDGWGRPVYEVYRFVGPGRGR